MKVKSGSIDVGGGTQLYYEECGEGPVLVLLHGMWGSCRFFRHQLDGLSSRFRVIAPDLRGHGRSSMTLHDQTVPTYARDVHAFLHAMEIGDFVGVGWSMGAFVWWDYARLFGAKGLRGHVVIDQPPSDWQSPRLPNALLSFDLLRDWYGRLQSDRNTLMREVIPMMFAVPPAASDAEWMFDEMTRAPEVVAAAVMFDQSTREYYACLANHTVPTLVCGGALSAQPRAGLELITQLVPESRLVLFEGCGHCLFLEDPVRFNAEVAAFADSLLPRR